jgi:hypothetical protein
MAALAWAAPCQEVSRTEPAQPEQQNRHILGLIPNYRTYPSLQNYRPLTVGQKFKIASEDGLDLGTFVLAGAFGGLGQLTNSNKSFGQGAAGFGKYFGASYAAPGSLTPSHRSFGPIATAAVRSSTTPKWLGNSTAVAISNAYYPDHRSAGSSISKLTMQVGVDAIGNVLKEFWPDLLHKFSKKSQNQTANGKP